MTSICLPSPVSMTGMRTGGEGCSSGFLRRGSISGSGSSMRIASLKKALVAVVEALVGLARLSDAEGEKASMDPSAIAAMMVENFMIIIRG